MFFKQIKYQGDNFSYIIADERLKTAAVVDPSFNSEAIVQVARTTGFKIKYIINTHGHWDHTAGNKALKTSFNAKIVAHKTASVDQDVSVDDGDSLELDGMVIEIIHTPGHTPDSICLLVENKLLTGDTLFVGECGRTDIPGGNPAAMYNSLFTKILTLSDDIEVYPGHDYGVKPRSTIGIERKTNYTLEPRTLDEFIQFMKVP